MKELSKEAIAEMKEILAIRAVAEFNGKAKVFNEDFKVYFDQEVFTIIVEQTEKEHVCGTAACMAGFKVHFDALKAGFKPMEVEIETSAENESEGLQYERALFKSLNLGYQPFRYSEYAMSAWGLNWYEAESLFDGEASLKQQLAIVYYIEDQLRIGKYGWDDRDTNFEASALIDKYEKEIQEFLARTIKGEQTNETTK